VRHREERSRQVETWSSKAEDMTKVTVAIEFQPNLTLQNTVLYDSKAWSEHDHRTAFGHSVRYLSIMTDNNSTTVNGVIPDRTFGVLSIPQHD